MPIFGEILTHIAGCNICKIDETIKNSLDTYEDVFVSDTDFYSCQRIITAQCSLIHDGTEYLYF